MEFLAPLLAALRPVVTAEAVRVLDQIAAKAASGAEEDIREAERDLLAFIASHHGGHGCDLTPVTERLDRIETTLKEIRMSQSDIDAAVATDTALLNDLTAQTAAVAAAQQAFAQEIATLESQGVDTSGLNAANAQLSAAQAPLDAAVQALSAASQPAPAAPPADGSGTTDGSAPADGSQP